MVKLGAENSQINDVYKRFDLSVGARVLFLCLGVSFALLRFDHKQVGSIPDDATYIVLGRALYSGQGYRLINFPEPMIETAFPPGWPILIGLYEAILPVGLAGLKVPAFLFWIGALYLSYRLFVPLVSPRYRLVFIGLLLLNSKLIHMSGTVSSEPAFLFFSLLTLVLFEQWRAGERRLNGQLLLVVLFALFTTAIRTIGVALLVALAVALLWELRNRAVFKWLLFGVGCVVYAAVFALFNDASDALFFLSPLYQSHVDFIGDNLGRFLQFWRYGAVIETQTLANNVLPVFNFEIVQTALGETGLHWLSWAVLGVVLLGAGIGLRRADVKSVYVLLFLFIYYLWTVYIGLTQQRIGIPLVPFMLFYFVQGMAALAVLAKKARFSHAHGAATVALWTLVMLSVNFNVFNLRQPYYERVTDLSIGSTWIRENSEASAVVMSTDPVQDYLYHERASVFYTSDTPIDEQVWAHGVDFVLLHPPVKERGRTLTLDPVTQETVLPQLLARPERYAPVFHDEAAAVWLFKVMENK